MRSSAWMLVAAAWVATAAGCGQVYRAEADRFTNLSGGAGYDRGLVIALSGVGGVLGEVERIRQGLAQGGVECAIEEFDWSAGDMLVDQTDLAANKAKARMLTRRIETYFTEHPGCPVHLFGVSAGTGLVVWALEDLEPGRRVDNVVLIASSLSARYDLRGALRKVGGRLYNHYSAVDGVLGVMVPAAGTVDRAAGLAGGLRGFRAPSGAEPLYGERLQQVGWSTEDSRWGHVGSHMGATQPPYVREYMAPLAWARKPTVVPQGQSATGCLQPVSFEEHWLQATSGTPRIASNAALALATDAPAPSP